MIALYQFEISPFCDKVRRLLHFKGQPYEVVEVRPSAAAGGRFRTVSPSGKFPVIEHGGRRIDDSTDIAYYLEETFPEPRVLPDAPGERALVHVLEDWADESLYFYEMTMRLAWADNARRFVPELLKHEPAALRGAMGLVVPRAIARIARGQGVGRKAHERVTAEVGRHVGAIDALLGDRDWLVGERLTLADIAVFAQLACIRETEEGAGCFARAPTVEAWLARVDDATRAPAAA